MDGHPILKKLNQWSLLRKTLKPFLLFVLLLISINGLFTACSEQSATEATVTKNVLQLTAEQPVQPFSKFVKEELPVLGVFTERIYLLETLSKGEETQIIFFAPSEEALTPYIDKIVGLKHRTNLLKKGIVVRSKNVKGWDGIATTYGGVKISVADDESSVTYNNDQKANILRKIQSEEGHLIYVVDRLLS